MRLNEFNPILTESLAVGDPVIITGNVEFQGKTGDVRELGRDGAFVVVNLYNHGPYSFQTSDVSRNDYADAQDEQDVTEVSKSTLDRYVAKASDAHGHADFAARMSKHDPDKRSYHVDQKNTADKRRQGISRALDRVSKNKDVAEGNSDWSGSQGNFAGDKPFNLGGDVADRLDVNDTVSYFGEKATILAMSKDRTVSRIDLKSGITQNVKTSDLKRVGQGVAEQEKIGNMDADRFDDAMARLKRLAGAGPLKTVWDPQKRVYKNMPTAVQPLTQPKK
jgi:hypothetical protein